MMTDIVVLSRDGKVKGKVINEHAKQCKMEGCRHDCASVRWEDGKLTYPCWGGLESVAKDTYQLM